MATRTAIVRSSRLFGSSRALAVAPKPQWQPIALQRGNVRMFAASSIAQAKKYTHDHEWIELDTDGKTATLGISNYAAEQLGDVVYVELPEVGLNISAGDAIGAVESVKSASDILTPVDGEVVESNQELEEKPATLNKEPEGRGWIAKILIDGAALEEQGSKLMSAQEYKAFTEDVEKE